MSNSTHPEMPDVGDSPTTTELIEEIFQEAGKAQFVRTGDDTPLGRDAQIRLRVDWDMQKIGRVRRGEYIPKLHEYIELCASIGKTPSQVEDLVRERRAQALAIKAHELEVEATAKRVRKLWGDLSPHQVVRIARIIHAKSPA